MQRRTGGGHGFRFQPQRLIHTAQRVSAKAAGKGGAGQIKDIPHTAQTQTVQPLHRFGRQAQGGQGQVGQHMAQMARRGDHALWCSGGTGSGGGITAPLPPAAFNGARTGGPRLLVNRIAVAQRGRHPPRIARQAQAAPRVSAMPARTVSPSAAQSCSTCTNKGASPPNKCAQPVRSITSAAGCSSATQGLNLPAQRRSTVKNAASAKGSAAWVKSPGHMAEASRNGWPSRNPTASPSPLSEVITCAPF